MNRKVVNADDGKEINVTDIESITDVQGLRRAIEGVKFLLCKGKLIEDTDVLPQDFEIAAVIFPDDGDFDEFPSYELTDEQRMKQSSEEERQEIQKIIGKRIAEKFDLYMLIYIQRKLRENRDGRSLEQFFADLSLQCPPQDAQH